MGYESSSGGRARKWFHARARVMPNGGRPCRCRSIVITLVSDPGLKAVGLWLPRHEPAESDAPARE
jgi:hypothetical protein